MHQIIISESKPTRREFASRRYVDNFGRERRALDAPLESIAVILLIIPPFFRALLPQENLVTLAMTLIALLLLLAASSRSERRAPKWNNRESPISLILIAVFFGFVLINNNRSLAGGENILWIVAFGGTLCAVGLLLACRSREWTEVAFLTIAVFGLVYAVTTILIWLIPSIHDAIYPLLQAKTDADIAGSGYRSGLTTNYSTNGMYITLGFLSCSLFAMRNKDRRWIIATCICLFALILIAKRAHLAFGLASFAVSYFALNSNRKLGTFGRGIVAVSVALVALYIMSFFSDDVLSIIERFQSMDEDDTFGGRSGFYNLCLSMWNSSPLIGNGWGSYPIAFNGTVEGMRYQILGFNDMNAHNVYLQVLAEEGLLGFCLLVGSMLTGIVTTYRAMKLVGGKRIDYASRTWSNRFLLSGSLSIQLFFAMYCLTGNPLYDIYIYVPWLMALGVSTVLIRESNKELGIEHAESPRHGRSNPKEVVL